MSADRPLVCAIDAQIAPETAGGTETALLSLLKALGRRNGADRYVVIGIPAHAEGLGRFLGANESVITWPDRYAWFAPANGTSRAAASEARPLGPLAQRWTRRLGPAGRVVPPVARLYHRWRGRRGAPRPLTARQADRRLRAHGVDVVHFPYPHFFATGLPFVYEPWGLPHLHLPEKFAPGEPEWMEALFRSGCEKAALVVTATRWVKEDIAARYAIPREKIAVIPRFPRTDDEAEAEPEPLPADLPPGFALYPAMTWPAKNHIALLRALARLRDEHARVVPLVCTGRPFKPHWPALQEEVARLGLQDQVHFLGAVSPGTLRGLFRAARFLVFPSLFEGLGLPPMEAFREGLPVLASNASCIPEVVGDAALLFDPRDERSITGALRRALEEPELLEELRRRGRARLAEFSPERMADMFVACYRRAAGHRLSREEDALFSRMTA